MKAVSARTAELQNRKIKTEIKNPESASADSGYFLTGRGGEIRTHGLLYPKQARYQTAPRPDNIFIIDDLSNFVNYKIKFYQNFIL